ncbi:MAG: Hcp family type VI secretion system effector [Deltaproteobacteria bacterium]|jgi:type VI secretion system secreted protein Hcp|nr:Hcp family type VI secretion system effector [Deltaproteobacteria bacterium]MBW2534723.1 Hcp family type VI secretion system effector [Deltaproteobacteria bacterium]
MALNSYLRLKGETQGEIKGSVTQAGREDSIMIIGTSHEVVSPRDAASGLPTGKRQHKPFVVTKEVDKSTPLLFYSLTNNENIPEWELQYWQPSKSGQEVQFYTVKLYNASIAGIRQEMLNNKYPENMQHKEREHISFCYQKIEWTWVDGGISAEDDWESPLT